MISADDAPAWLKTVATLAIGAGGAKLLAVWLENRRLTRKEYRETLMRRIMDLEKDVSRLQTHVGNLRVEMKGLEDELEAAEKKVDRLEVERDEARARLDDALERLQEALDRADPGPAGA